MSQAKELEIRRQFLDEATAHLSSLETALIGIADHPAIASQLAVALRTTHSIKGGAGLMGLPMLSALAHRLETVLQALLKQALAVDRPQEQLLLTAVDRLRWVVACDRQALVIEPSWLTQQVDPLFAQLHQWLSSAPSSPQRVAPPLPPTDIVPLLFATEVEDYLQQLTALLADPAAPDHSAIATIAEDLEALGHMLQLADFTALCTQVRQTLAAEPEQTVAIAQAALPAWRQAQALILAEPPESASAALNLDRATSPATDVFGMAAPPGNLAAPSCADPSLPDGWTQDLAADDDSDWAGLSLDGTNLAAFTAPASAITAAPAAAGDDPIAPSSPPTGAETTVRVPIGQLNQLNDWVSELTIEHHDLTLHIQHLRQLLDQLQQPLQALQSHSIQRVSRREFSDQLNQSRCESVYHGGNSFLFQNHNASANGIENIEFDVLEIARSSKSPSSRQRQATLLHLQKLVHDLESSLAQAEHTTHHLNQTTRQLQTGLTHLRLRPLADVVDQFPRLLRDLALQYDKVVNLDIMGAHTLIERTILEGLQDPLLHLLRNAFDHGIEDAATRQAQGKPATGLITLQAAQRGHRTLITIADDGAGIALAQLRNRALQLGLEGEWSTASAEELLALIFTPGFSTRERATPLSGRGVGLDVVRHNLQQIQGEISVTTQVGRGTTFTLSLPLTLAVIPIVLAESNGRLLAFPATAIEAVSLLDTSQIIADGGQEWLNWQGDRVLLQRLEPGFTFNRPPPSPPLTAPTTCVLILRQARLIGLPVDRCWGEQTATLHTIAGDLPLPIGFSSCTILVDGRVVPLVNMPDLLHWLALEPPDSAASIPPPVSRVDRVAMPDQPPAAPLILIVDDSVNLRHLLALTLERAGYQVAQAEDGQAALQLLASGVPVAAILCDLEMPRLDGWGFLTQLRANSQLAQPPVTLLTARPDDHYRQRALQLGAIAYLTKPYREQDLLNTVAQMVAVHDRKI